MKISEKDWKNYISRLRKVNDLAAQKVADYMTKVDINTAEGMKQLLDYSYAVATRYGEAATELACQMYDAVATVSKVSIPSAEPAETATYGEVVKAVKGKMFDTKDPSAVGSAVGKLVKMAGIDTTMKNALRDGAEWAWIPSGDTCAFCLMLASNGWQKASRNAIRNGHAEHIHHNCDCTYQIRFDESLQVEGYDPDALYDEYIGAGETRQERLNTIRRKLYAKNPDYYRAQKRAAYARRMVSLHRGEQRSILNVSTGGKRNEIPLNDKQIENCYLYAESLGMPRERIVYSDTEYWTSYNPAFDILLIGTDAYPNEAADSVNGRLSYRCSIAHEIIGHREVALRGKTHFESGDVRDEAQASIRAARFAPNLTRKERYMLLKDGVERLYRNGYRVKDVRAMLDIIER